MDPHETLAQLIESAKTTLMGDFKTCIVDEVKKVPTVPIETAVGVCGHFTELAIEKAMTAAFAEGRKLGDELSEILANYTQGDESAVDTLRRIVDERDQAAPRVQV